MDYLIENDDENPLIDFTASKLPTMKITALVSLSSAKLLLKYQSALRFCEP